MEMQRGKEETRGDETGEVSCIGMLKWNTDCKLARQGMRSEDIYLSIYFYVQSITISQYTDFWTVRFGTKTARVLNTLAVSLTCVHVLYLHVAACQGEQAEEKKAQQ